MGKKIKSVEYFRKIIDNLNGVELLNLLMAVKEVNDNFKRLIRR